MSSYHCSNSHQYWRHYQYIVLINNIYIYINALYQSTLTGEFLFQFSPIHFNNAIFANIIIILIFHLNFIYLIKFHLVEATHKPKTTTYNPWNHLTLPIWLEEQFICSLAIMSPWNKFYLDAWKWEGAHPQVSSLIMLEPFFGMSYDNLNDIPSFHLVGKWSNLLGVALFHPSLTFLHPH